MAANVEVTLEQILNKISLIAEKLGEKTTAKERQEENLKKYNDRRKESAPSDTNKRADEIADNIADIAEVACRNWIPTLDSNESKRFENIAKVYNKTLKLSDNFTAIKQLLGIISSGKQPTTKGAMMKLPTFDVSKIITHVQLQYVKFGSAIDRALNIEWFNKTIENKRKTNWLKKFESINNLIQTKTSSWFASAEWDWFEASTKNKRRINWSKQFEPLKKFFSVGDVFNKTSWIENADWSWFEKNTTNKRRINWSDKFAPLKKFFSVGDVFNKTSWFKNADWSWFEKNKQNTKRIDWSKQFEPLKKFFSVGDMFKIPEKFKNINWNWFEGTAKIDFNKEMMTLKSYITTPFQSLTKSVSDKFHKLGTVTRSYISNLTKNIGMFVDGTNKSIKESTFIKEFKRYKDVLKAHKDGASAFLSNIATQISSNVLNIRKKAGDFINDLQQDLVVKYTSIKESIKKMLPTFKKKDTTKEKIDGKQSFADKFKTSAVGIVALGAGIALLIGSMIQCKLIDAKSVGIFAGVVAVMGAAIWGLASKSEEISKGSKAIGILSIAFGLTVLALKELTNVRWDDVSGGLLAAGVALTGLALLAVGIGKFATKNVTATIAGGAALVGLTVVIGMLGDNLGKFANYDWKTIDTNLGVAAIAITGFGLLAGILGGLIAGTGGIGALVAVAGIAAIYAISSVMGYTGEQLLKYKDVDGDHLKQVGGGLKSLGAGLAAFFLAVGVTGAAGIVGGAMQGMAKWFDLDMVSQMQKYEKVDGAKIDVLGKSLTSLATGFKDFASISNDSKQFSAGIGGLKDLEKLDVNKIGSNLDSIAGKLSNINNISSSLSENTSKFKFEISGVSEMSDAINQMGQQEVDLLQQQLMVLSDSRELLAMINKNTTNMSRGGTATPQDGSLSVTRESSTTRQSFFNNLKMMSTSLKD